MKDKLLFSILLNIVLVLNSSSSNIREAIKDISIYDLEEFSKLYQQRPIKNNQGGMKSVGMFWIWFITKHLKPKIIIESGIWKGQSTWLLEKSAPNAKIIAIDPQLKIREYISKNATYHKDDFSTLNFKDISKERTLCFFDDHQDVFKRIIQAKKAGFEYILLDDNYPLGTGSHLTLQHCFQSIKYKELAQHLNEIIEDYIILPNINSNTTVTIQPFKKHIVKSLNITPKSNLLKIYEDDALSYRWTTLVKLKK